MTTRLILAVISTVLEEAALAAIVLVGLPRIGIKLPLVVLITLMVAWGVFSVFTYWIGSRALRKKPVVGLPAMVGGKGKVASPLTPEGFVRIKALEILERELLVRITGTRPTERMISHMGYLIFAQKAQKPESNLTTDKTDEHRNP